MLCRSGVDAAETPVERMERHAHAVVGMVDVEPAPQGTPRSDDILEPDPRLRRQSPRRRAARPARFGNAHALSPVAPQPGMRDDEGRSRAGCDEYENESFARDDTMLFVDKPWSRALYLQVRDALAQRIATGEWAPGSAVPNERDLAHEIGVSTGTARKALELLEAQNLVTRRQGRGTFVNDPASDKVACRFIRLRTADGESLSGEVGSQSISEGTANELECSRLRLCTGDRVYRIRRDRRHRGRGFLVADITLPAALFPRLAGKGDMPDRIGALAPWNGMLLGKAEERVSLGEAPGDVGDLLCVATGTPVMLLDCVLFLLGTDQPVAWRLGYVHLPDGYYLAEWR